MPPAVDAREGSGDARQARPRRARQPQVHVRGPASNSRARQGDSTRRKRVPRRTRSKGRRRRRRHDDKEEEDTGRERWVSPRGEERLRLQRRARWDKISRNRAVHSPGGRGEGCGSSAGSSAPSPARGFPLARLTAVENGADRTPPTIGSSRGSDGTGRSVAGERPRTERPPALSDFKLQTSNFKRASTEPHPAPALPPASGTPAASGATGRRRAPRAMRRPPPDADEPPRSSSRIPPPSPRPRELAPTTTRIPGTSTFECLPSGYPRMNRRAWARAGGCP